MIRTLRIYSCNNFCMYQTAVLVLLSPGPCHAQHDMSGNRKTRCWYKESDFFWQASRLIRWQTNVVKHHLNSGLFTSFFYGQERGSRRWMKVRGWLKAAGIWTPARVLGELRDCVLGLLTCWPGSAHDVPQTLQWGRHCFHMYFLISYKSQALGSELFAEISNCKQNSFWCQQAYVEGCSAAGLSKSPFSFFVSFWSKG